jgi:hypothetical protein
MYRSSTSMASRKILACGLALASLFVFLLHSPIRAQEPTTQEPSSEVIPASQQPDFDIIDSSPDPALANMAPVPDNSPEQQASADASQDIQPPDADSTDPNSLADNESDQPPPDLFDYDQPFSPGTFYLWTPGYWAHSPVGFFWVPGQWVVAPFYGALWTPPYWGFSGGRYLFHGGYWGTHVGFYGGVNYGFGYIGTGYFGGFWRGHDFYYNRAVSRVDPTTIATVYNRAVVFHGVTYGPGSTYYTSYNGGARGLKVHPTPAERVAIHETHLPETTLQSITRRTNANHTDAYFSANHGHPMNPAMARLPLSRLSNGSAIATRSGEIPTLHRIPPAETLADAVHRQDALQQLRQQRMAERGSLPMQSSMSTRQERIEAIRQGIEQRNVQSQSTPPAVSESPASETPRNNSQPSIPLVRGTFPGSPRNFSRGGLTPERIHHAPEPISTHPAEHPTEPTHSIEQPRPVEERLPDHEPKPESEPHPMGEEPSHLPVQPTHSAPVTPTKPPAPRPVPARPH